MAEENSINVQYSLQCKAQASKCNVIWKVYISPFSGSHNCVRAKAAADSFLDLSWVRLIHSKRACWKGSATWIEHTVWVTQHVFDRDVWDFSAVLCTVHVDRRLGRLLDLIVHGLSSRFWGWWFRCNIPPLGTHLFLTVSKGRKRKANRWKKNKTRGKIKKKIYIYSRLTWKKLQVYFILLLL